MASCTSLVKWMSFLALSLTVYSPLFSQDAGWLPDSADNERSTSDNGEPPTRISGGLVQQLRSFTDEIFGSRNPTPDHAHRQNEKSTGSSTSSSSPQIGKHTSVQSTPRKTKERSSDLNRSETPRFNLVDALRVPTSPHQGDMRAQYSDHKLPPQPSGPLVLDSKAKLGRQGKQSVRRPATKRNDTEVSPRSVEQDHRDVPQSLASGRRLRTRNDEYEAPIVSPKQAIDAGTSKRPSFETADKQPSFEPAEVRVSEFVSRKPASQIDPSENDKPTTRATTVSTTTSSRVASKTAEQELQDRNPEKESTLPTGDYPSQAPKVARKSIPKRNGIASSTKSSSSAIEPTLAEAKPQGKQPEFTSSHNLKIGSDQESQPTIPPLPSLPSLPSLQAHKTEDTADSAMRIGNVSNQSEPLLPKGSLAPKVPGPQEVETRSLPASMPQARVISTPATKGLQPKPNQESARAKSIANAQALSMEIPRVHVQLIGPSDMPAGAAAGYEVVVQNQDRIPLSGLIVRIDVPAGVEAARMPVSIGELRSEKADDGSSMLTWTLPQIAAGDTARMPLKITAREPRNFAIAMEWTVIPLSGSKQVEVRQPQLQLALDGPSEVEFGVPHIYRLKVSNSGSASASNVTVKLSAEPYGSSTAEIGELAAGKEKVVDVELTFQQRGTVSILADASGAQNLRCQSQIEVKVKQAQLAAELVMPSLVYHGSIAACEVHVANSGDADAIGAQATILLPPNCTLVSRPDHAKQIGDKVVWDIEKLLAGATATYYLQLNTHKTGTHKLQFVCSTPSGIRATAEAATHVEAIADLKLLVNDPQAPAPVNADVTYELTLTNRGSRSATGVIVVAQFSEGIEPTLAEGAKHRIVPGQVLFDAIGTIAAGETVTLKVVAKATIDGTHRFRAEVRCEENETRLVHEESTRFLDAARRTAAPPSSAIYR